MTEDEQREATLTLLRELGLRVDTALRFVDGYAYYADRMTWAEYRQVINEACVKNGPCMDHRPPWPDLSPAQILAKHRPMTVAEFGEHRRSVYARRAN